MRGQKESDKETQAETIITGQQRPLRASQGVGLASCRRTFAPLGFVFTLTFHQSQNITLEPVLCLAEAVWSDCHVLFV